MYRWYSMYLPCFWFLDGWQNESWLDVVSRGWRINLRAVSIWFVTFPIRNSSSGLRIVRLKMRNRVNTYCTDCTFGPVLSTNSAVALPVVELSGGDFDVVQVKSTLGVVSWFCICDIGHVVTSHHQCVVQCTGICRCCRWLTCNG